MYTNTLISQKRIFLMIVIPSAIVAAMFAHPMTAMAKKQLLPLGKSCTKNQACASGSCVNKKCIQYIEWDAGNDNKGDAPNSAALAQTSNPLKPGKYGYRPVRPNTIGINRIASKKDIDIYKIVWRTGTWIRFTAQPLSKKQDLLLGFFDSNGNIVATTKGERYFTYREGSDKSNTDFPSGWVEKTGDNGFEETIFMHSGIRSSRDEDSPITTYLGVTADNNLPGDYTIDFKTEESGDAGGLDAPASIRNATRIEYNTTYKGYVGFGDVLDCYTIDPTPAIGKTLLISVKPKESTTNLKIQETFYSIDGSIVKASDVLSMFSGGDFLSLDNGVTKIEAKDTSIQLTDGGAGFEDRFTVFPYYAAGYQSRALSGRRKDGWSSTLFTTFCIQQRSGGNYELRVTYQ